MKYVVMGSGVEVSRFSLVFDETGRITGAILQGNLAYSGILQQLIAWKIDVSKVKNPLFNADYSDFFRWESSKSKWMW